MALTDLGVADDHRDADVTFGGCGDPSCPTGTAPDPTDLVVLER